MLEQLCIASYYRQLSADFKIKNYEIKTIFVNTEVHKYLENKTGTNIMILF